MARGRRELYHAMRAAGLLPETRKHSAEQVEHLAQFSVCTTLKGGEAGRPQKNGAQGARNLSEYQQAKVMSSIMRDESTAYSNSLAA